MADRPKYPSEAAERFQVRLPNGLRDRLRNAAEANGRSMNSEIVLRLENALDRQDDGTIAVWLPPDLLARVRHAANIAETDPNLLIVYAVEDAYPAKPNLKALLLAVAEDIRSEEGPNSKKLRSILKVVEDLESEE